MNAEESPSASTSFSVPSLFQSSFCFNPLFFSLVPLFFFSWSVLFSPFFLFSRASLSFFLFFWFSLSFFFFSVHMLPFFLAQNLFQFSPKPFFFFFLVQPSFFFFFSFSAFFPFPFSASSFSFLQLRLSKAQYSLFISNHYSDFYSFVAIDPCNYCLEL